MKKYMILAAVAALTLASCAKIETNTRTLVDEEIPVGFSTYSPRSITKAGDTFTENNALPNAAKIGVYGYSTPFVANTNETPHFLGTENPEFITNGEVAFSAASSTPTGATDKRYWPKDLRGLLTFYAYYPYNDAVITSKPAATTAGLGSFAVTQKDKVEEMVDFMISDVQNDMYFWDGENASTNVYGRKSEITGTTYGIVPLTLHHMMSNVNFFFKTNIPADRATIKVKEASIAGVLYNGTFTPTYTPLASAPAATATNDAKKGATSFGTAASGTAYATAVTIPIKSVEKVNNVDTDVNYITLKTTPAAGAINYKDIAETKSYNNFLFIPQGLTDDVKVTIKYEITELGNTEEYTSTVKIKGVANDANNSIVEWKYNHKYNYIFTIGLHEILFTGSVTEWTDGGTGNITVL